MISHIYIKNYALIRELRLDLQPGFTTLTGETGAGKSIMLGALGLALGNRADVKVLADEAEKCVVEVHFDVSAQNLSAFFEANDVDASELCILRREILPSGKSRAFINDTPVLLDALKELGERLVDVHSQHDSLLLMNTSFQLEMIDGYAGNTTERKAYLKMYQAWNERKEQRKQLLAKLDEKRDLDYLRFLVEELDAAKVQPGEVDLLEVELKTLRHSEEIQLNLGLALNLLDEENAILDRLRQALRHLELVYNFFPQAEALAGRLRSAEIELRDVAAEINTAAQGITTDSERLADVELRYNLLQNLLQKHRAADVAELQKKHEALQLELHIATSGAAELAKLDAEIALAHAQVLSAGAALSKTRQTASKTLEARVATYLTRLQLGDSKLSVSFEPTEPKPNGTDAITLLFAANTGSKPQALAKVASGGELSRVMLALKAILAQTKRLPAIIFDEIDTGISGETANRVAEILNEMGQSMQVLAITHLPQIAARGAQQLQVSKASINGSTATQITQLSTAERVDEIARLLSGAQVTEAARKTAEELLRTTF